MRDDWNKEDHWISDADYVQLMKNWSEDEELQSNPSPELVFSRRPIPRMKGTGLSSREEKLEDENKQLRERLAELEAEKRELQKPGPDKSMDVRQSETQVQESKSSRDLQLKSEPGTTWIPSPEALLRDLQLEASQSVWTPSTSAPEGVWGRSPKPRHKQRESARQGVQHRCSGSLWRRGTQDDCSACSQPRGKKLCRKSIAESVSRGGKLSEAETLGLVRYLHKHGGSIWSILPSSWTFRKAGIFFGGNRVLPWSRRCFSWELPALFE